MKKDWGFAAFIEVNGKHIMFDTGDNPDIFAQNVKAAHVSPALEAASQLQQHE